MSDDNALELIKRGDARFAARQTLDSLRQEIALQFAPDLACWTTQLQLNEDFAAHLVDGTPLIIAEEYIGMIGSMLRPAGKQWFWHRTGFDDLNNDPEVRDYLDWRSTQMMRITFDRITGAEGALTETDRFYGLFGDGVLSTDYADNERNHLKIESYHTKDCTWSIGRANKPDTITRKETPAARNVLGRFTQSSDKVHEKVKELAEKAGDQTIDLRHEVLPADEYDAYVKKKPKQHGRNEAPGYYSVWVDATNRTIIRERWQPHFRYVIPRAARRYGYAYGISRATMIALPDARLIQQQALAILEAAEKQVNPPLMAATDVLRGAPQLKAYSINYYDKAYDDRTGQPLYPIELAKNFKLGIDALMRTEAQIARAFKLDRMRFPDTRSSKTREEAQFMIDEFVRAAVPMFSPMKSEYSDEFLFEVDSLIDLGNGYAMRPKPKALQDVEMSFQWDNPLTDMLERQKTQKVGEIAALGNAVATFEATAQQSPSLMQVDTEKMFRESAIGIGTAGWLIDARKAKKNAEAQKQANAQSQMLANAPNIAQLVDSGVNAAQAAADIPNPAEPGMPLLPAPV